MDTDSYFKTSESITAYEERQPVNAKYNLDLLAREGITPSSLKGRNVLDVGCGFGLLLKRFQEGGARCYGTDISELAISRCRERCPGIRAEVADCTEAVPFKERFSLVTAFGLLGVVAKDRHPQALSSVAGALDADGMFFATAPNAARAGAMDMLAGKTRSVSYNNARTAQDWEGLLAKAGFVGIRTFAVLRIPKTEAVLGRNIFLRFGSGDPIVISARKPRAPKR